MTLSRFSYDEQFQAAVSDVRRRLNRYATHIGTTVEETDSVWIRVLFEEFSREVRAGNGIFCAHITSAPMVGYTAAWALRRLVCTDCRDQLQPPEGEESRCDRCGEIEDELQTGCAAHGPVLMAYGLCTACAHAVSVPVT